MTSTFKSQKTASRPSLWGVMAIILTVLMISTGGWATVQADKIKDELDNLSFSHDGKKVFFDRCRDKTCQIQVYDLATGELSAYQSPSNERWTMARMSDDGKKIVFSVIPRGEKYLELGGMQITVMDLDGRNMKRITSGPGAKIYPTFSHSGRKVLYARAGRIRESGRTPAADFDAWEVDLDTGKEKQLTHYKYFIMSNLGYFPDDERFIFDARHPRAYPGIKDGDDEALKRIQKELAQKKIALHGIQVMRGEEILPLQYFIKADFWPRRPLLSKDGTRMFFEGEGGMYYLYSPHGNHRLIGNFGSIHSTAISPDGEWFIATGGEVIYIFRVKDGHHYRSIVVPTAAMRNPNWDRNVQKNPEIFKLMPETPSKIINQ